MAHLIFKLHFRATGWPTHSSFLRYWVSCKVATGRQQHGKHQGTGRCFIRDQHSLFQLEVHGFLLPLGQGVTLSHPSKFLLNNARVSIFCWEMILLVSNRHDPRMTPPNASYFSPAATAGISFLDTKSRKESSSSSSSSS